MKKKIISSIILVILLTLSLSKVLAYSGEVDPENCIYMPTSIYITNGKGTGTISLSSFAGSGYEISYQKSDLSSTTFNNINNKNKQLTNYHNSTKTQKEEKESNLNTLQTEYNNLRDSGTATQEQLEEVKNRYDTAYAEYQTFINTVNTQMQQYQKELYDLVPTYNSSWTKTTNTSNNVNLDFTAYSGTIHFILWAKVTNGTNTYYDFQIYSSTIKEDETPEGDTQNGEWTNTSSAKVNIEQLNDVRKYRFTISSIAPIENHTYYYFIGDANAKPTFSNNLKQLRYDETKKILYSEGGIEKYLELAADQYLYVYEYYLGEDTKPVQKMILNKVKLQKPVQKKYTDVFWATMISKITDTSDCTTQILFDTPWADETVRKVHIKIGKISDDTVLKNIYKKKDGAFEDLLKYAKNHTAFYDKTLNSNSEGAAGGIQLKEKSALFNVNNIVKGDYYFLYAVVEDESGKYVKTEGVTLARAEKLEENAFSLFFYGGDNFTWKAFEDDDKDDNTVTENKVQDNTIAPGKIPQTGTNVVVVISTLAILGVGSVVFYSKWKKYRNMIQ